MSSIFYYEPFYEFERLIGDTLQNRFSSEGSGRELQRREKGDESVPGKALRPRMDLHEDSNKNLVTASFELPGLKKEDVNIDVHNNRLTVSGESKMSKEYDEHGWAVCERRFGKFSRTLQLPQGVKDNQIKANMDNGVLTVTFPKASEESAPKKITVN
ncbi:Heat shock protein 16 [Leucoagaricus sp. SymC.cos]|nr:Heat shock protein 16 [Leucoagaricus sp. SymC.cos]